MFSVSAVCNEFIRRATKESIILSPMKLQKLLFFLYGRYLADTDEQLFSEPFAVWKYGPVVESMYHEFKCFGADNITDYARDAKGNAYLPDMDASENELFFLTFNKVWNKYKGYAANYLAYLTHLDGTPWHLADKENRQHIPDEYIKKYFKENINV